ncbi:MAG TPA: hypothetical protein ENG03_04915 [Thioploca sp.]|nr:MAG: hypothetical protein DRR08_24445 [Gammaproteobacteria bacterium]HDN26427.1 hypothetical protein [Thioploca sp.]
MKKLLISGIIAISLMQWVQAETICDARIALADARFNLMMMVMSTDKAEQDALKAEIDNASTELENAFAAMLQDENKTDDAQINKFQKTWAKFKNTRETGIVPAIYAGDDMKAIAIATGIQAKRMTKMTDIIQALNGDNCN